MRLGRGSLTEVIFPEFSITYWAHCIHFFDIILDSIILSSTMIKIKEIVFHHVIPMLPSKFEQNFDQYGSNHFLRNSHMYHLSKMYEFSQKDMAGCCTLFLQPEKSSVNVVLIFSISPSIIASSIEILTSVQ